jgi:PAS domain S-box-containing protein
MVNPGCSTYAADMGEQPPVPSQRLTGDPRPLADVPLSDAAVWALLDAAPDGLLMIDATGRMMLVNSQLERLFGYDRAELLGQPVEMLLPDAVRAAHREHRDGFFTAPRTRAMGDGAQLFGRRRDGSLFPVDVSLSPLDTGEAGFAVAAVRDATERQEREAGRRAAALMDEQDRIAENLANTVIRGLFGTGLKLQGLLDVVGERAQQPLANVVADIDATIREIRTFVFALADERGRRTD